MVAEHDVKGSFRLEADLTLLLHMRINSFDADVD